MPEVDRRTFCGAQHESYAPTRVSGHAGPCIVHRALEGVAANSDNLFNGRHVQPQALSLCAHHTARPQSSSYGLVKGSLEQSLCRTNGVRRIHDDGIVCTFRNISQESHTIANVKVDTRIIKANWDIREKLLGHIHNHFVDFADVDLFNGDVTGHFSQYSTIATSYHQHLLGVCNGAKRQVGDHLLVSTLVSLRQLDYPVQHQHSAVSGRLKYHHVLEIRFPFEQKFLHLQRVRLSWPHGWDFGKPSWHDTGQIGARGRRRRRHSVILVRYQTRRIRNIRSRNQLLLVYYISIQTIISRSLCRHLQLRHHLPDSQPRPPHTPLLSLSLSLSVSVLYPFLSSLLPLQALKCTAARRRGRLSSISLPSRPLAGALDDHGPNCVRDE